MRKPHIKRFQTGLERSWSTIRKRTWRHYQFTGRGFTNRSSLIKTIDHPVDAVYTWTNMWSTFRMALEADQMEAKADQWMRRQNQLSHRKAIGRVCTGETLCRAKKPPGTDRDFSKWSDIWLQKTIAEPTKPTDRTKESRLDTWKFW